MRWWRRHAGVRVRSTMAAACIVAVALLVAMLAGWWLLRRSLTNAAIDDVAARSVVLADEIRQRGTAALDLEHERASGELVQVLTSSGQVVAAAPPASRSLWTDIPHLRPGGRVVREVPTLPGSTLDEPHVLAAREVTDPATGRPVVVVVGRSVAGLADTVGVVGDLALAGTPLLVLVTAGATYLFTGRALAPVEELRRRVRTISARRLQERLPVPPVRDEIGRLAETMNDMLGRLEAAQDTQQRFLADAGHELRSPLATITVALEVARMERFVPDEHVDFLDDLTTETTRMSRLVEDLLFLARADEHGLRLRAEDVDLDDLVEAEGRRLRATGDVEVTLRTTPARVVGDPDRLGQLLRNLADNARRHAVARVRLQVGVLESGVLVRVEDDGPGVPIEERERVFDRFVRLDAARDRGSGGSGLGLSIVKEIVAGHGGQVSIDDSPLGGARVDVLLPGVEPQLPGDAPMP